MHVKGVASVAVLAVFLIVLSSAACGHTEITPEEQFESGRRYATGEGVPQDDAEAVRRYRLAAEQGHAVAQGRLGVMYSNGDGVPRDYAEGVRWLRLAAEQGDATAQFNLGAMYRTGPRRPGGRRRSRALVSASRRAREC